MTVDSDPKYSDRYESSVAAAAREYRAELQETDAQAYMEMAKQKTSEGPAKKDQTGAELLIKHSSARIPLHAKCVCVFEKAARLPLWFVCAVTNKAKRA